MCRHSQSSSDGGRWKVSDGNHNEGQQLSRDNRAEPRSMRYGDCESSSLCLTGMTRRHGVTADVTCTGCWLVRQ